MQSQVLNDFFTIVNKHNAKTESSVSITLKSDFLDSMPIDLKSILLSTNNANLDIYIKSKTFIDLVTQSIECIECIECIESNITIQHIQAIQRYILEHTNPLDLKLLKPFLLRLNTADLLDNVSARGMINLFSNLRAHKNKRADSKHINISALSNELAEIHKRLIALELNRNTLEALQKVYDNAKNNKFSIGITGVLSAGKSTFLNALMGQEILSSSTVPETANLAVLKYDKKQHAKVYFWNALEWQDMIDSSTYDSALATFIDSSNKVFGNNLKDFIQQDSRVDSIELSDLARYTSANHESKLCNLVKKVELFTDLAFLQHGVEIVDTPGLDDPITKREDITKAYLQECDLLIHVMNASCAATQIDIDFILESLLQRNVSRLLVILTRIDLVEQKELEQSLEYTKNSIALQLKKAQYSGDVDSIIDRIDFIPTASFFALLHRTNRAEEAMKSGFNMEKTGILDVESYLDRILLGGDSLKQKDILYLAYKAFLTILTSALDNMRLELKILNSSSKELEQILEHIKSENNMLLKMLDKKTKELESKLSDIKEFLQSLQGFIDKSMRVECGKLRQRVYDDIIYHYDKGTKVDITKINEIIDLGFSDIFSDVGREYKYKLANKVTQILGDISHDAKRPDINFQAPKDKIFSSIAKLKDSMPSMIDKYNKHTKDSLYVSLEQPFIDAFSVFVNIIKDKNAEVADAFLAYSHNIAQEKKADIQKSIKDKEDIFSATLAQKDRADSVEYRESISKKISGLNSIVEEIRYIEKELR